MILTDTTTGLLEVSRAHVRALNVYWQLTSVRFFFFFLEHLVNPSHIRIRRSRVESSLIPTPTITRAHVTHTRARAGAGICRHVYRRVSTYTQTLYALYIYEGMVLLTVGGVWTFANSVITARWSLGISYLPNTIIPNRSHLISNL